MTLFSLPRTAGAKSVASAVIVPAVDVYSDATGSVSIPVPQHGSVAVDRNFTVGQAKVAATRVKRMPHGSIRIRFSYAGPVRLAGPGKLRRLNGAPIGGPESFFTPDGAMSWLQVTVPPGASSVTLGCQFPTLAVTGPWRLPLRA